MRVVFLVKDQAEQRDLKGGFSLMKKKLALGLVFSMFMGIMAGCGSSAKSDTIKVGGNFEQTGGNATFGKAAMNGAQLVFDKFNTAGGLNGKKIEFIPMDNKSDATESTSVVTKLIQEDGVVAVLGATTSGNTLASVQIADDNKIPMIASSATNPDVTVNPKNGETRPYIYRACFIDPFQGTVMANFATQKLNAKTAAIYVDNAAPYSKGLAKFFKEAFEKNGGTIIAEEGYMTKDQDFRATLTKTRGKKPDVIYVPGYYQEVGLIAKQARELGLKQPMMGGDGWDSADLVKIAGADALNNGFFSNHYSSEQPEPIVQNFVKEYKAKFGQVPDSMAVLGYDAALMYIEALKKAGTEDPEKVKAALDTIDVQLVTGKISLDDQHNPKKGAAILEMKNGKQVYKDYIQP
jgi:branched-chain amino acid transport system substrate-binding protein